MSSRLFCLAFKTYFFYVSRLRHEQTEARLRLREGQMSPSNLLVANVTEPPADTWLSAWLGAFNLSIIFPSPWPHRQRVCVWGGGHVGPKVLVCTRRCGTFQHQDSSPQLCIAQRLRPRARPQPTPISPNQFCTNAIRRRAFKCQCPAHLSDPSLQGRRF